MSFRQSPWTKEPAVAERSLARRTVLTVAASAIAAGAVGVASSAARAAQPRRPVRRLRVACYNIHHGVGVDDVLDLERQARLLARSGADIIGLQEVDRHWSERSAWVDQAAWFGERLGMAWAHGANLDRDPPGPGAPRRRYGTAILSRWPIISSRNTLLPWESGTEQRGLLETIVDFHGRALGFASTHLQHRSQDAALRLAQAQRIVELLGPAPRRTFLVGDLNAGPETPEVKVVADVLLDAWAEVGRGAGLTYPAEQPEFRIDYVFGSPDAAPVRAQVTRTTASDHRPITVDYLVR
jgi:endonuclease/exonuclease/phosphatase family metal-dependent hydrolase